MDKDKIRGHFEKIAADYDRWKSKNSYYYDTLKRIFSAKSTPQDCVIEYGCGTGDILASVPGRRKIGLDISGEMVLRAKEKHPNLEFIEHDCEIPYGDKGCCDVAILADIIDHITDILRLYETVNHSLAIGGLMCISTINPLWDPIFRVAEKLGQKMPEGDHNFVPNRDLINMLRLRGFSLVEKSAAMLIPKKIPLVSEWINSIAPKLPGINEFCMIQILVAQKVSDYKPHSNNASCSVVIPCFNEEDNLDVCISRIPIMGKSTEIIIVDDGSQDRTAEVGRAIAERNRNVKLISYSPNKGKGNAVKAGFDASNGDIIMILDADMTVMPEELPLFFEAIASGIADFANGTRLVYPMEHQAMRFLNLIGNFFFGSIMSWLLKQRVSDTLCGTKALKRSDYAKITMGTDTWGDFDLLFGAAENNLSLVEIPVHYKARTGGESKMKPFKHCLILLKACLIGFYRLKVKRR